MSTEEFQIAWDEFYDLLTIRYDYCEENTLSILKEAYKLCKKNNSDPLEIARQYAMIYAKILSRKRNFSSNDEYCYEMVRPGSGDLVVSAGGDIGHEIPEFLEKTGASGRIIIFEPSQSSLEFLNARFSQDPRIRISNNALHSSSSEIDFFESCDDPGVSSMVSQRQTPNCKQYKVRSISLDDYVDRNNLDRVDFIKMDIEGAEFDALLGAKKTLERFKPMLAICVYHRNLGCGRILDEDILRIPDLIRSVVSGYRLFLVNTEPTAWGGMKMFGIHQEHIGKGS
ncbi:MAG: FkbM family methyltransferase [Acidobacteriota bacterium]